MKNKKWYLPMLLLAMTMGYSSLKACHEGDFGALNKGHYKWGKNVGIFQYTENITILTITSTSCISTQPTLRLSMTSFRSRSHRERGPNSTPWLIFQDVKSRQFPHSEKPCMRIMTHCSVQTRMQESFETRSSISSKQLPRSVSPAASN